MTMNSEPGRPPKFASWLLRHFAKTREQFFLVGDFEEEFKEIAAETGYARA
jgi:hypothetical protein